MFTLGKEAIYQRSNIAKWTFLAFQAGAINIIGFLAGQRFVSHVTGFASLAGIEFSNSNWSKGFGMLTVPLFFLLGAMIAGYCIDLKIKHHRQGGYETILFLIFASLMTASIGSLMGFFGNYGDDFSMSDHYLLLVLLSGTCGLQNAMITTASGSIIRTTHLTGIFTDLGIGLTRLLFSKPKGLEIEDRRREKASILMRLAIIGFFTLGSLSAAILGRLYGYWAIVLPTTTSLALWILVKFEHKKMNLIN